MTNIDDPKARTALVTGGSGGIGEACAVALIKRGCDVTLTARTEGPLRIVANKIGARWAVADASDPSAVRAVVEQLGRIDVLVHAAGILDGTFVRKESVETFDAVIRANLRSTFVVCHEVLPAMPSGGKIILISSTAANDGHPGRSSYAASKAGVNGFARSLALEVVRDGITVHVISPGPVDTAMLSDVNFEIHALHVDEVENAMAFVDSLAPGTELQEIVLRPPTKGPLAKAPLAPAARNAERVAPPRASVTDSSRSGG